MSEIAGRSTMKAGITRAGEMRVEDVPMPVLGPGEALVKVKYCGLCGSDLHPYRGRSPLPKYWAGHEISGEVVQLAGESARVRVGDRVFMEPTVYCGDCRFCRSGQYYMCENYQFIAAHLPGGFAEYVRAPVFTLHQLPDGMSHEEGAMIEPVAVATHAVGLSHATPGGNICVLGAGTIGLLALQVAKAMGAGRVFITAKYPQQAKAAVALGADAVLAADGDVEGEIKRLTDNIGVDAVIESVGGEAPTPQLGIRLVRKTGRMVLLGGFRQPVPLDLLSVMLKEMEIVGSYSYGIHRGVQRGVQRDFEVARDLIATRRVNVGALVTHVFPLEQIDAAFRLASGRGDGVLKVLISA